MSSKNNPVSDLEAWFSSERMKTYSFHSDPDAIYLWNTRVTKSFLEDIQHVEVLLRNCVDTAVSPRYGQRWYVHPAIPFDRQAKKSIQKAERRAGISAEEAMETHILLFTQARGTAILLEPETEAESITGVDADTWIDERIDKLEQLSSNENHAALKSLIGSGYALDLDRAYERGLALMVDGIFSRLARTR